MILSQFSRPALFVGVSVWALSAAPAFAQDAELPSSQASEPAENNDGDELEAGGIVVQGQRLRGALDVEQAPLLELSEEDIAAEGVASIADLVTQISAQTSSSRGRGSGGRPVILVNGIRPGSFRELFQYPPEALEKLEVFPEEVAQRFGFPPDRRVINLILKDNYRNAEVEFEFEGPSRGGNYTREQELGFLQISNGARINVNFEANDTSLLTEDERDIVQTQGSVSDVASDPDTAPFRSLISDSRSLEANISWAKAFLDSGTAVSANAFYERRDARALQGLNSVLLTDPTGNSVLRTFGEESPIEQSVAVDTFAVSGSVNTPVGRFRLTSTLDATLAETQTRFDQLFDTSDLEEDAELGLIALDVALPTSVQTGFDQADRRAIDVGSLTTLRGPLVNLPGGELIATFDLGLDWDRIESSDTRSATGAELTRRRISTGANLNIPITSRREGFADALGSFTLNLQAGFEDLSDFGLLGDYTGGLTWGVFENLDLTATYIYREVAPSLSALGDPQVVNFNLPVFDFTNGETVLVDVTTGGNPELLAETQRDWKFAANWEVPFLSGARLQVEYIRNRSDNVVSGFPQVTQEIEAAFPGRITRDAGGTLIALDRRQVTFAETRADRLNFGFNLRGRFGGGIGGEPRGGPQSGAGRPASTAAQSAPRSGAGGGVSPRAEGGAGGGDGVGGRRAAFMQFRTRICADDGLEVLTRLAAAIVNGEDLSEQFPGFNPQRLQRMVERAKGEDGEIDPERLAAMRTRICSMDPSSMRGPRRGAPSDGAANGRSPEAPQTAPQTSQPAPPVGFNPLARRNSRGMRYFFSLNHTIQLENEILIAPGLAPLDQLDGQSTNAFGFPSNTTRLEAGLFGNGVGMRLSGRYTGSTRLDGSGAAGSGAIFFDDLATFNLRLFANIGQLTGNKSPILENVRVSLRADNVFDAQLNVVDENGDTPLNFQPFLIDPVGRFVGIDIRKLF